MKRKEFLRLLGCSSLGLLSPTCISAARTDATRKKPNIIFLLTDDQRDNTFGIMGHEFVKTPNIDRIIRDSVRFSNAYIAEPTCCPSRVAFFTGMHERVNGVGFTSAYRLNESQWEKSYPALLRKNGYFTGFIGKFGVEYYTFRGEAAKKFDYWRGHNGWAKFFPKTAENCTDYYDSGEDIITPVMGESITRFLDKAPTNQPFCLSVSFSIPHGSQTSTMHPFSEPANKNPKLKDHPIYGDLYRDKDIKIPAETTTDPYKHIPKALMDQEKGRIRCYEYDYDFTTAKEHHIRYYQQITGLDKVVGQMSETLQKKELDKDTVIIFASDHGLLMGEYGMGGKALLYDLTSKFPCFVHDPRLPKAKRGRTDTRLVSSLDITSTILDYAGIPQPAEMEGESLLPLIWDKEIKWRDTLFLENLYTGRDTPFSEGIRKEKWKYIRMYDGVVKFKERDLNFKERLPEFEQLFDLEKDPAEKHNLIGQYKDSKILSGLRKTCQQMSCDLNQRRDNYIKTHEITNGR